MSSPSRHSMRTQVVPFGLCALTLIALTFATPSVAFDARESREAVEAWLDEMQSYFEAHPELREAPGSGWKPYNRVKWFLDQRRADGELPHPMARWQACKTDDKNLWLLCRRRSIA